MVNIPNIFNKIRNYFGNLLYYPGCLTRFALPEIENNYVEILKKLDLEFVTIPDYFVCCGAPVLNAGYVDEFNEHKGSLYNYLKKYGITKIVTSCPTCYHMLKNKYNYDVKHATQAIYKHINKLKPISEGEKITFHDPCHLGRYEGVYNEPRAIVKAMGFELIEMKDNKEKSLCCGAGAGLRNVKPRTSAEIAKIRGKQAADAGTKKMVTCCPMCYSHLKENAPKGVEVYELSELLVKSLGIEVEKKTDEADKIDDDNKDNNKKKEEKTKDKDNKEDKKEKVKLDI